MGRTGWQAGRLLVLCHVRMRPGRGRRVDGGGVGAADLAAALLGRGVAGGGRDPARLRRAAGPVRQDDVAWRGMVEATQVTCGLHLLFSAPAPECC